MTSKLEQLSAYFPLQQGRAIKARAVAKHGSVSQYIQLLIEQDQTSTADLVRSDTEKLNKRLDDVLDFALHHGVQNATAERLSPGLMAEVQKMYLAEAGSAPDARYLPRFHAREPGRRNRRDDVHDGATADVLDRRRHPTGGHRLPGLATHQSR